MNDYNEASAAESLATIGGAVSDFSMLETELAALRAAQSRAAQRETEIITELQAALERIVDRAVMLGVDAGPTLDHQRKFVQFLVELRRRMRD